MRKAKDRYIAFAFNLLIFALLFIGHYSLGGILTVKNATPLLILPMLTAFSMFNDELASALTGLFFGIFMDGASSEVYCFNALVLLFIGLFTSLISKYLFNRNIRSVAVLSILGNLFYFCLKWLIFYAFDSTISSSLTYLLDYAIPSAIYSAVFIIPFFFLERAFYRKIVS
ncbi:MAG: rod shape-determining protein MreD [Clostridia bacterium]|nr:rod shape-determining protein MreD [Clostridia bacterium]